MPGGRPRFDEAVPPGGYVWWYLDGLSEDGRHGITVIAFVGSVFSPYYAWARRRGAGDPGNHCAINVAIYGERGKRWAMTERGRRGLRRDGTSIAVGPSAFAWDGDALVVEIDEMAVPLPTRIQGRIVLRPTAVTDRSFALDPAERHRWWPIAPSARLEVDFRQPALRWRGHGYLDSNWGSEPLEDAFVSWDWSRAPLEAGAAILYDVVPRQGEPRHLALVCDSAGSIAAFDPPPAQALPRGLWRVARATRADPGFAVKVRETLEDAPFYARSILDTQLLGQRTTAMHESLSLRRFDSAWVQMMLPFRMPRAAR